MARQKLKLELAVLFAAYLFSSAIYAADELPFQTYTTGYKSLSKEVLLDALVEAVNHSTVSAETTGRVMEVKFDIGDFVQAGTVLIRVTKAEQQSQFAAAQAQQNEAEARLKEAQEEFTRVQEVYGKKLVAKSALDRATADLKAAEQRLKAAVARVKQAKEQLRYTEVKAPFSGVVVDRYVEVGEMVTPGKPVMSGLSLHQLRVAAQVPQSLITRLQNLGKVKLIFPQFPQNGEPPASVLESQHIQVSPQADPLSHTFLVRAYLPENTPGIYPGMMIKMALAIGEKKALLVPEQAIVHRSELTAVYVVQGNIVHLRQVRIGHRQDAAVEILAGLDAGEQVALDPVQAGIYLKEQRNSATQ